MKVRYSKEFIKAASKQSGKIAKSIKNMIEEVKKARSLADITDIKKLTGYKSVYRIRVGSMRAFVTLHVEIVDDTMFFHYLVNRGEAYNKESEKNLKRIDN